MVGAGRCMNEDDAAIRRVLGGDVEAFRFLVERYQRPILRFVAGITGDRELAEDIGQEVFLGAYRKLRSFDPDRSRFSTWLFTIARNKALTVLRGRRPAAVGDLSDCPGAGEARGEQEQAEWNQALDRALDGLPLEQKTAFVLAEFEKLSYEEIARIERTRIGTVRSRISRAREKLRKILREYGDGG
jgi:RNA polymerase sigma-70 factor, ECF subfamily